MACGACARIGTNDSGSRAHSPDCTADSRYMKPAPGDVVQGSGWERAVIRDGVQIGTVGILSAYRGLLDFYSTEGRRSIPVGVEHYIVPTTDELIAAERAAAERENLCTECREPAAVISTDGKPRCAGCEVIGAEDIG